MPWKPDYIELAEFKHHLGYPEDDTEDDDELALDITAASRAIDDSCNRQFGSAAGERFYRKPWFNYDDRVWVFEIDDVMVTPTTVEIDGVTVASNDYELRPINASADGKPWTQLVVAYSYMSRPCKAAITANPWGWSAIPDTVKKATRIQAHRFKMRREAAFGIAFAKVEGGDSLRLQSKADPDVALMLKGYRRKAGVA